MAPVSFAKSGRHLWRFAALWRDFVQLVQNLGSSFPSFFFFLKCWKLPQKTMAEHINFLPCSLHMWWLHSVFRRTCHRKFCMVSLQFVLGTKQRVSARWTVHAWQCKALAFFLNLVSWKGQALFPAFSSEWNNTLLIGTFTFSISVLRTPR